MASTKIACLLGPGFEDSEFRIPGRTLTACDALMQA
jgi:putative intracellular protease/amidase